MYCGKLSNVCKISWIYLQTSRFANTGNKEVSGWIVIQYSIVKEKKDLWRMTCIWNELRSWALKMYFRSMIWIQSISRKNILHNETVTTEIFIPKTQKNYGIRLSWLNIHNNNSQDMKNVLHKESIHDMLWN